MAKKGSRELFTQDEEGRITDAPLHDEILDNPQADELIAAQAIERAIQRGMSRSDAEEVYGVRR